MKIASPLRVGAAIGSLALAGCSPPVVQPDTMTTPMSAADVRIEIARVRTTTPFPEAASWEEVELDDGASYGPYAGGSMVEWQALCAWLLEARAAIARDDPQDFGDAAAVLRGIPQWRTFADPVLAAGNTQAIIRDIVDAATAGETAPVDAFTEANCKGKAPRSSARIDLGSFQGGDPVRASPAGLVDRLATTTWHRR